MNAIFAFLACATLANAGGIPSYSISDVQPDRSVKIVSGPSWGPSWGVSSGILSSKSLGGLELAPLSLSSKSIRIAQPTILSAPLLSKGLSWGQPLALAEPSLTSKTIITRSEPVITRLSAPWKTLSAPISWAEPEQTIIRSEPLLTRVSAPLISKSLSGPISWAEPERTIIRSQPLLTRVSAPLITKTLSAPISWAEPERTIIRSEPLLTKLSAPVLTLAEPLAEPLGKTIITRSQPTILLRSEPQLLKTIQLSEPTLLSDSLLGQKLWLKK